MIEFWTLDLAWNKRTETQTTRKGKVKYVQMYVSWFQSRHGKKPLSIQFNSIQFPFLNVHNFFFTLRVALC